MSAEDHVLRAIAVVLDNRAAGRSDSGAELAVLAAWLVQAADIAREAIDRTNGVPAEVAARDGGVLLLGSFRRIVSVLRDGN